MQTLALLLVATLASAAPASAAPAAPSPAAARPTPAPRAAELARWERMARNVTITRDDWGIAHVRGKTDADAVFGMIYAQAEDDFNRVETNYLNSMGRLAEAEGAGAVWQDLRMKLFIDPDSMRALYKASPAWLKRLMDAWADGLNYYLATHPDVRPRVLTRFEPWMALTFSEGSIGGDIERVSLRDLEAFYGTGPVTGAPATPVSGDGPAGGLSARLSAGHSDDEPRGSNGIAVAPSNTVNGRALLLINPHTSFFFRSELQMTSDEGLNAYGAVTWGQFFVYQGFNPRAGWMHTSSGVDAIDEYLETVTQKGGRFVYKYGKAELPVVTRTITVPYRTADGMAKRTFTAFFTRHGPVVRAENGKWVAIALMQEPLKALQQSYLRTKAGGYADFRKTMELHTNSSNNTIFADADGNIAYFHANFIPRRDTTFDWSKPVDGSNPATDWRGVLPVDATPSLLNPATGWLYNSNDWPWSAAGAASPRRERFPKYVETGGPSARGRHAVLVLEGRKDFTLDRLVEAAYDSYLPWFEQPIPALARAWEALPEGDTLKEKLREQVALLRTWDRRWATASVPTALGVFWGEELRRRAGGDARDAGLLLEDYLGTRAPAPLLLEALAAASDRLAADFGKWQTPWGEINRFQRLTGAIVQPFSDSAPSTPVGFTSALWGSLASFGARPYPGTKRWYGTSGNSFVAVVEFGKDSVRARAVTAGGESGHPASPHFDDQAQRYAAGDLREVYFYPAQLAGHTERVYQPGK
ncbi:MAG TPA: penicillin acylase family protein [Gemmatimonadales bacterium]|nr:penicillin acylase family protein [Gemmatimonadales bacterium]